MDNNNYSIMMDHSNYIAKLEGLRTIFAKSVDAAAEIGDRAVIDENLISITTISAAIAVLDKAYNEHVQYVKDMELSGRLDGCDDYDFGVQG